MAAVTEIHLKFSEVILAVVPILPNLHYLGKLAQFTCRKRISETSIVMLAGYTDKTAT